MPGGVGLGIWFGQQAGSATAATAQENELARNRVIKAFNIMVNFLFELWNRSEIRLIQYHENKPTRCGKVGS